MSRTETHNPDDLGAEPPAPAVRIDLPVKPNLCGYCRLLIVEGADPDAVAYVYRADALCFAPTRLSWFADRAVSEASDREARFIPYREPFQKGQ